MLNSKHFWGYNQKIRAIVQQFKTFETIPKVSKKENMKWISLTIDVWNWMLKKWIFSNDLTKNLLNTRISAIIYVMRTKSFSKELNSKNFF